MTYTEAMIIADLKVLLRDIWDVVQFDWDLAPEELRENAHLEVRKLSDEALKEMEYLSCD
jgi:hypothetical protein